jgi:hypothetical protein
VKFSFSVGFFFKKECDGADQSSFDFRRRRQRYFQRRNAPSARIAADDVRRKLRVFARRSVNARNQSKDIGYIHAAMADSRTDIVQPPGGGIFCRGNFAEQEFRPSHASGAASLFLSILGAPRFDFERDRRLESRLPCLHR